MSETTNKPGTCMLAGWGAPSKNHVFCSQVETASGLSAESAGPSRAAGAFSQ